MFYHCMHISCQVEVVLHVRAHKKKESSYPDALTTVVLIMFILCVQLYQHTDPIPDLFGFHFLSDKIIKQTLHHNNRTSVFFFSSLFKMYTQHRKPRPKGMLDLEAFNSL